MGYEQVSPNEKRVALEHPFAITNTQLSNWVIFTVTRQNTAAPPIFVPIFSKAMFELWSCPNVKYFLYLSGSLYGQIKQVVLCIFILLYDL